MKSRAAARIAVFTAALCCMSVGQAGTASASSQSIKAAIVSYSPKIDLADGRVLTAVGEYEQSKEPKDPAGVQAAIANSIGVLSSLRGTVALQSARPPRVKKAKAKIEQGLGAVIVGYRDLSTAYGEVATNRQAATTELGKAEVLVKKGRKELREGARLLG